MDIDELNISCTISYEKNKIFSFGKGWHEATLPFALVEYQRNNRSFQSNFDMIEIIFAAIKWNRRKDDISDISLDLNGNDVRVQRKIDSIEIDSIEIDGLFFNGHPISINYAYLKKKIWPKFREIFRKFIYMNKTSFDPETKSFAKKLLIEIDNFIEK
ncbi:hypothetical protein HFP57_05165 [Parasphingopyxis algicola]|uniref:hypothetical protein n=1 Tax=Parasphingopyxis algicola TaxID=2026624 RepID=UPI0015A36710|nr:hypothetical protein [Parasphingopyxis algicola]QLC24469.1 hypothetical protein HFP57_05165 [Parasphingopyxis algicola]